MDDSEYFEIICREHFTSKQWWDCGQKIEDERAGKNVIGSYTFDVSIDLGSLNEVGNYF